MLDWMLPQFVEVATGKSLPSALAAATGISEWTLKKGPPKRATTWQKGIAHAREQLGYGLLQSGRPGYEANDFLEEVFQGKSLPDWLVSKSNRSSMWKGLV